LAKPNYRQQKRQKELSRKTRQAEKLNRRTGKLEGDDTPVAIEPTAEPAPTPTPTSVVADTVNTKPAL